MSVTLRSHANMNTLLVILRLVHIACGVYWAGTIFFFTTFLQPSVKDLGPDGGKVMIRLFERGYLTALPVIAVAAVVSGWWMLWIVSSGFESAYMGSRNGIALSTGGLLGTVALLAGLFVMRPAALRIWAIAKEMPTADESRRGALMAEMGPLQARTAMAAKTIFSLLAAVVILMAVARSLA